MRIWWRRIRKGVGFGVVMCWYAAAMSWRGRRMERAERVRLLARMQAEGSRALLRQLGWTLTVEGDPASARVPTDVPTLVIGNHIGVFDPWIVAAVFESGFVAKAEMASWPVFGWVCRSVGIMFAHRENRMKTGDLVNEVQERMTDGVPVAIFPEGTTSNGTLLLPFKTGGFAALMDAPVGQVIPTYFHARCIDGVPVTEKSRIGVTWYTPETLLENLRKILHLDIDWVIRIGEPIPSAGHTRKSLADASRAAMLALMEQERTR